LNITSYRNSNDTGDGCRFLETAAAYCCWTSGATLEAVLREHQVSILNVRDWELHVVLVELNCLCAILTLTPYFSSWRWVEGDAFQLPFTDCYFDAITVGYGLRNVVDKPKAMQEIFRVLKPGSFIKLLKEPGLYRLLSRHLVVPVPN
jgi:SAM-dependent methyltransferase